MRDLDALAMDLSGTSLIEASAGTGKTYTLTTLYLRLLVERGLLPAEILVVTYTQAATAELRERVRERIREAIEAGEASDAAAHDFSPEARELGRAARSVAEQSGGPNPLRRALREFDEAAIFTIHGFCQRALAQNAFESGVAFDSELIEAAELLQQTLARDLWARGIAGEEPEFVEWLLRGKGKRWEFEPDLLKRGLIERVGADEEMPVLPELSELSELPESAVAGSSSRAAGGEGKEDWLAWAQAWPAGRERIASWLLETPDLNRNKYNAKSIESKWLPQLDDWCAEIVAGGGGAAPIDLPDWWQKLTPGGLTSGVVKKGVPLEDPVFDAFEKVNDFVADRERRYSARALALRRKVVDVARREARTRREEKHQFVFDDLLSELRASLRPPAGDRLAEQLRAQYRFALIDEFQDTDPVQYEIFRRVWHGAREAATDVAIAESAGGLILIGDPKQAIYSFRGADLFTYLAAARDAGESIYGLGVNRRSDPGVIAAVNTLFGRAENAFGFSEIEFHPVVPGPEAKPQLVAKGRSSAGLRVLFADHARYASESGVDVPDPPSPGAAKKQAKEKRLELPLRFGRTRLMDALARDVAELLESGGTIDGRPIRPSDIAVLCRRKVELERVRRAFESLGIPCIDRGDSDVFDTVEAWELVCILRAMLRSGDGSLLRAALATGAVGWNSKQLAALGDDSDELARISERYAEYGRIWKQSGFARAFEAWRRGEGVTQVLLGYVDGERRLTNWLHLAELLQRVVARRSPSRSGLANWLERAIADTDLRAGFGSDASLLRLESDEQAVSLVTLHRSKGLEYEIVYLPSLWEDSSPRGPKDQDAAKDVGKKPPVRCHDAELGQRILDLGSDRYAEHLSREKEEALSESLRLLYVGMTRAKRQCVLLWGAVGRGGYAGSPLAWLLHAAAPDGAGISRSDAAKEMRDWKDENWRGAFDAWGRAAGEGGLSVESADWSARGRWAAPLPALAKLSFERESRSLPAARRTTSFSGLTRGAYGTAHDSTGPESIGRDVDAETIESDVPETPETIDLAGDMDSFPRGADAGTLLHEVLEQVDFSSWDEEEVRGLATRAIARHGLGSGSQEQILHVVRSLASTPLPGHADSFRLRDISADQLRPEMEFTLAAPGKPSGKSFTPDRLASLLAQAEAGSPLERYASRVSRLDWGAVSGYLRGFIDAIFFDGARYCLVDYKSNHLGSRQLDYAPANLLVPMVEHDYVLQYLIYSVALDRHLLQTCDGYRYESHFGGVYYLFLRGIAESHAPGSGVFFDRPEERIVRGVSRLLGLEGGVDP